MSQIEVRERLIVPEMSSSARIEDLATRNSLAYEAAEEILLPFIEDEFAKSPDVILSEKTEKYGEFIVGRASIDLDAGTAYAETFALKDYTGNLADEIKQTGKMSVDLAEIPTYEQTYSFTYPTNRIPELVTSGIFKNLRNRLKPGVASKHQQLGRFEKSIVTIESALAEQGYLPKADRALLLATI